MKKEEEYSSETNFCLILARN